MSHDVWILKNRKPICPQPVLLWMFCFFIRFIYYLSFHTRGGKKQIDIRRKLRNGKRKKKNKEQRKEVLWIEGDEENDMKNETGKMTKCEKKN